MKFRFQWNAPIRISPHNPDIVYVTSQVVHRSMDRGRTWDVISPDLSRERPAVPEGVGDFRTPALTDMPRRGVICAVGPSPLDVNVIWAGTDDGLIHVTRDGGRNWQDVTPPDLPQTAYIGCIEADRHDPGRTVRCFFEYEALTPGYGWCVHPYAGAGDPLPPFPGAPYALPLQEAGAGLLQTLWERLNGENRIALALKLIAPQSGTAELHLINQYRRA